MGRADDSVLAGFDPEWDKPAAVQESTEALFEREKSYVMWNGVSAHDYRMAPSGEGVQAGQWKDKPHRLIYDLLREIDRLRTPAASPVAGAEEDDA